MRGIFYAVILTGACLAALAFGYAFATYIEEQPKEKPLPPEVRYYGTVEAQGVDLPEPHFESYEDYEAHVAETINDRGVK